jgi:hypothetical protein
MLLPRPALMSFTTISVGGLDGLDFCLIFTPCGCDEPEILHSSITPICPMSADAGSPALLRRVAQPQVIEFKKYHSARHAPAIERGFPWLFGKNGRLPPNLRVRQPERITRHGSR